MGLKIFSLRRPVLPCCAHCGVETVPCPQVQMCAGTRVTGLPRSCTSCHQGRVCPRHGRLWSGAL